jgi:ATPase subunit of ABC transporter with duplicated ATPase domains
VNNKKPPDNDKFAKGFFNNRIQGKFSARAKSLESRLEHLEKAPKPEAAPQYRMSLSGGVPTGKLLLEFSHVSKSFGQRQVVKDSSWSLYGSQRVQVCGPNGSGKTTLLRLAAGLLEPDTGKIVVGAGVRIGYLSQQVDGLDYASTALDNLLATGQDATTVFNRARILGLGEADLRCKPGELSRGQQAKLAFAKLLFADNQLLILDEPTNHLDIPTRQQLEAALQEYNGALLVASHDAYFIDAIGVTDKLEL